MEIQSPKTKEVKKRDPEGSRFCFDTFNIAQIE